jgi:hypothetical protein
LDDTAVTVGIGAENAGAAQGADVCAASVERIPDRATANDDARTGLMAFSVDCWNAYPWLFGADSFALRHQRGLFERQRNLITET